MAAVVAVDFRPGLGRIPVIAAGWLLLLLISAACCAVVIAATVLGALEDRKFKCWEEREMDDYGNECKDRIAELEAELAVANLQVAALLAGATKQYVQWTQDELGAWHCTCGFESIDGPEGFTYCPGCGNILTQA